MSFRSRPPIIPNLPDVVLRQIFNMFNYKELCAAEGVCRRWQSIIHTMMRRDIHDLTIERLGTYFPSGRQIKAFKRLNIHCPGECYDFLSGVLRRSRLSIMKMTADLEFLANIEKLYVNKEARRKYFSNVEDLWLLIVAAPDRVVDQFMAIEDTLFSELSQLTLQVHILPAYQANVSKVIKTFLQRYPNANINLELHAETSKLIYEQLEELPSLPLNKIKIICTDFELPQLRLDRLFGIMAKNNIIAKNITIRDWSLFTDGTSPVSPLPLDTFRISSCTIETVDSLIVSLRKTAEQEPPKPKKKLVKRKKVDPLAAVDENGENAPPVKKKVVIKRVVKKKPKVPFIKKLEIAGQCTLHGLQFLERKAHTELEKRLGTAIPEMEVDCSEIYYCF